MIAHKNKLFAAEEQKLLPILIDFLLDFLDHPLVALFEHVGKAALHLEVFLHRQLVLGLIADALGRADALGLLALGLHVVHGGDVRADGHNAPLRLRRIGFPQLPVQRWRYASSSG